MTGDRQASLRVAIATLPKTPVYSSEGWDEADDMCPNCVTPWKCNGPHERVERLPTGFLIDRAAVLSLLDSLLDPPAVANHSHDASNRGARAAWRKPSITDSFATLDRIWENR